MENLRINEKIQQNLLSSANWLQFITILAAIGAAFMILGGVSLLFMSIAGFAAMGQQGAIILICSIVYLVLGGLYIYPIIRSFNLIDNIRKSMKSFSQNALDKASDDFKAIMKFIGIMIIAIIVIYVIVIIGVIALIASGVISNL